jgi:hypothetical protein
MTRLATILISAWVLWFQSDVYSSRTKLPTSETIWAMLQAYETKGACEAERTWLTNHWKSLKDKDPNLARSATHVVEHQYSCWPDTIDPRTK